MNSGDLQRISEYFPGLSRGLAVTILVPPVIMALATLIGIVLAIALHSGPRPVARAVGWYIETIRAIPELVQIFLWYDGLVAFGIVLDALPAGILALSVVFGAFLSEVIRAGILAVPPTQWEAGQVLGMSRQLMWRRVILPQALRYVLPVWSSYYVSAYKATALLGIITVGDLLNEAKSIATQNFRVFELYAIVLVLYFIIGRTSLALIRRFERRLGINAPKTDRRTVLTTTPIDA